MVPISAQRVRMRRSRALLLTRDPSPRAPNCRRRRPFPLLSLAYAPASLAPLAGRPPAVLGHAPEHWPGEDMSAPSSFVAHGVLPRSAARLLSPQWLYCLGVGVTGSLFFCVARGRARGPGPAVGTKFELHVKEVRSATSA